ncbi:MAG: hypothetical protein ACYTG1_10895 [Planctomycetota bacterium]|jgi:hypothetical protein
MLRVALIALLVAGVGCSPVTYDPDRATRPYPHHLHLVERTDEEGRTTAGPQIVDMQVFRDDQEIEIVNSTARGYRDFDLWINQRFVHHVESLPAGATVRLSLWDFVDDRGDVFRAGGLFRTTEPLPVRMVQIQTGPEDKLVGLITIREED